MAIRLGDIAPDFTAETTEGTINFHEWLGDGWGLLFSHPADYRRKSFPLLYHLLYSHNEFSQVVQSKGG